MNKNSPITIVAPITSKIYSKEFLTNVEIEPKESRLKIKSTILLNQIRAIDKKRIRKVLFRLDGSVMRRVNRAMAVSLGIGK
jgi:mRNA interferase MazF